ncbi:MAG: CHAT domain-containing protein [Cyclobacteriaceae bacterium]|nr:CHAT domain-containing protein [Cyclobacteriaceae bacterium]
MIKTVAYISTILSKDSLYHKGPAIKKTILFLFLSCLLTAWDIQSIKALSVNDDDLIIRIYDRLHHLEAHLHDSLLNSTQDFRSFTAKTDSFLALCVIDANRCELKNLLSAQFQASLSYEFFSVALHLYPCDQDSIIQKDILIRLSADLLQAAHHLFLSDRLIFDAYADLYIEISELVFDRIINTHQYKIDEKLATAAFLIADKVKTVRFLKGSTVNGSIHNNNENSRLRNYLIAYKNQEKNKHTKSILKVLFESTSNHQQDPFEYIQHLKAKHQSKLNLDQLAVRFFIDSSGNLYAFAVSTNHLSAHDLGSVLSIRDTIKTLYQSMYDKDDSLIASHSSRLYQLLLGEVFEQQAIRKELLILTDGVLNYLPFDLLITDQQNKIGPHKYLVYHTAVSYHHSYELLFVKPSEVDALSQAKLIGFNPSFKHSQDNSPVFLGNLQYAREEVITISEEWGHHEVYLDSQATKSNLLSLNFEDGIILHLATHARVDAQDVQQTGIYLHGENNAESFFNFTELEESRINPAMVNLSACNTGLGHLDETYGITSLTSAFLKNGTPNVISALWSSEDKSTSLKSASIK